MAKNNPLYLLQCLYVLALLTPGIAVSGGPDPDGPTCTLLNEVLGVTTQDLDADETMWEFFSRHSLP